MVDTQFNPDVISENKQGTLYKISSGSGGFKASYESAKVYREENGDYKVVFTTPANISTVEKEIATAKEAISKARKVARRINVGMPGSGKITVPEFNYNDLPQEQ